MILSLTYGREVWHPVAGYSTSKTTHTHRHTKSRPHQISFFIVPVKKKKEKRGTPQYVNSSLTQQVLKDMFFYSKNFGIVVISQYMICAFAFSMLSSHCQCKTYLELSKESYKRTERWVRSQTSTWALPGFSFAKACLEGWQHWLQKQILVTYEEKSSFGRMFGNLHFLTSFCSSLKDHCFCSDKTFSCALYWLISINHSCNNASVIFDFSGHEVYY